MPLRRFSREQAWLLPPSLDELVSEDHPARFVGAFVDQLEEYDWAGLGIDLEGGPLGAPAYHPASLLGVWLYGFMTGTKSSRKLEAACREQAPYMWLTGNQRPDHNTLWRFYRAHRERMRSLLRRTVETAVRAELVDLALQAVDGTKVAASASKDRTFDAEGLKRLLERTDKAIDKLEAQNGAENDPAPPRLPEELAQKEALRERVKAAMAQMDKEDGPRHTNLTDGDAGLLKTGGGFIAGYNAQAMVSPLDSEKAPDGGMLITAADVTTSGDDHPQLVPMMEEAAVNTESAAATTLADAGYHSGPNLASCAAGGRRVLMPDTHDRKRLDPYHKAHFTYCEESDTYLCPEGQTLAFVEIQHRKKKGYSVRRYRADGKICCACPAFGACTKSRNGRNLYVTPYEALISRHRVLMATEAAKATYRLRKQIVEPAFGILKEQQGARRFLLRGLANVRAEWSLFAAAFNLRTLHRAWRQDFVGGWR